MPAHWHTDSTRSGERGPCNRPGARRLLVARIDALRAELRTELRTDGTCARIRQHDIHCPLCADLLGYR